jgi:hypothetical protein
MFEAVGRCHARSVRELRREPVVRRVDDVVEGTLPRLQGWLDAVAEKDPAQARALYRRIPLELRRLAKLREP